MKVILPAAATAIFLGMARVTGETAPLLFTAGSSNFWPEDGMGKKMPFLTYYIYTYFNGGNRSPPKRVKARFFHFSMR